MHQRSEARVVPAAEGSQDALIRALSNPRFELVPIAGVEEAAGHLPRGATVTVTSSPTRGLTNTLRVAEHLAVHDFRVVPHIAARLVMDESHLRDVLQQLSDLKLREIFVIGGDAKQPVGKFAGALELLRAIADVGADLDAIGVAAYPEGHPLIDPQTLLQALCDKQPFASYMVTQICFDPEVIVTWLAEMRQQGVELPVHIGLPGVVNTKQLLRISMKIGVGESLRFVVKHTNLVAGLFGRSGYHPGELVEGLAPYLDDARYAIQGLHINTFNQVSSTEQWRHDMLKAVKET